MLLLPDFRVQQRDYLLEIARAMTSQLNLDGVLRLILKSAASMLGGDVALVALQDDDGSFHARATYGVDIAQLHLFKPLLDDIVDDPATGLNYALLDLKMKLVARALDLRLRQVIALPMIIHEEMVGVLFVFRTYKTDSTPNDTAILQSFADQAAVAVFNARLYQNVSAEQQRLAAILDHSGDGIMILDAVGRILRFNKALARITGWAASSAINESHDAVIRWVRIDQGRPLHEARNQGFPKLMPLDAPPDTLYVEGDLLRADGSMLGIGITYAPLFHENGAVRNLIANVRDITSFRRAQELKSTFISVISHELKTPVALIKGYAGTLRRDDAEWTPEQMQNGLKVIEEEADRLTELIENLLAASKLQAEGMRLTLIPGVRLDQIAARAVERFQTQTQNHHLVAQFEAGFPTIQGDEIRLRQVLDNLISNAIKYSPKGGTITISGTFNAQHVICSVSDHGVGIADRDQEQLFERFFRVEDALSRTTQGTGLGLYLARAVVEAHHGHIAVISKIGQGSTFTFTLPRERVLVLESKHKEQP